MAEHSINQLANSPIQASASRVSNRLARRVPQHGGPNHRLRERRIFYLYCVAVQSYPELRRELLHTHLEGETYIDHSLVSPAFSLIAVPQVDENMQRAQKRNAVLEQRFWFRKCPTPSGHHTSPFTTPPPGSPVSSATTFSEQAAQINGATTGPRPAFTSADESRCPSPLSSVSGVGNIDDEYEEMTINEIINGNVCQFPAVAARLLTSNVLGFRATSSLACWVWSTRI